MYKIKIGISDVDYDSIFEQAYPILKKYHIPVALGKFGLALMGEEQKQKILLTLVEKFDSTIIDFLNRTLSQNNIDMNAEGLRIEKTYGFENGGKEMLEIKISVDKIDYKGIVNAAIPMAAEKIKEDKSLGFLNVLLGDTQLSEKVINAALDAIPEEVKDKLVISAVEDMNEKILEAIKGVVAQKGINMNVNEISIKKAESDYSFSSFI